MSLNVPKDRNKIQKSNPEDVFGIWKERDITIESIREKHGTVYKRKSNSLPKEEDPRQLQMSLIQLMVSQMRS